MIEYCNTGRTELAVYAQRHREVEDDCDDCFEERAQCHVDGDECEPPSGASDVSERARETRCTRGEM